MIDNCTIILTKFFAGLKGGGGPGQQKTRISGKQNYAERKLKKKKKVFLDVQ